MNEENSGHSKFQANAAHLWTPVPLHLNLKRWSGKKLVLKFGWHIAQGRILDPKFSCAGACSGKQRLPFYQRLRFSLHRHLSFLRGAKVWREPSCIREKCSGAHIEIWHGSMWFSQNVQQPFLPQRFPQVGEDARNEARSKILTFHTVSRSHSVSLRNKVPIFPQSLCPWHGPWTIHYHCYDGLSQKNVLTFVGIEKMLKRSK